MSDKKEKEMTRSSNIFALLQKISENHPDLRPGQILQLVAGRSDPFYWESYEWKARMTGMIDPSELWAPDLAREGRAL